MSEIKIDTSAQTVENEKTKKQKEELNKAKKEKEAAAKKAEAEKKKAKEAAEEAAREALAEAERKEKEKREKKNSSSALAAGGASLVGALIDVAADGIKESGKSGKKSSKSSGKGKFWLGGLIGLLVGAAIMFLIGVLSKGMIFGTNNVTLTTADEILEHGVVSFTAVDFQNAVLGEASRHQELIVMEQPLEITSTITKAGLGNLQIFSKAKTITYFGTGVYTVDMGGLDSDHVLVDPEKKLVTIKIPHSNLQYINPDLDKTEFEDTEKGLLAFGDLKLKTEDQNRLLQAVYKSMEERLKEEDLFQMADEFAQMSSWQMFQPIVTAISPEYTVEIVFDEETANQVTAVPD